MACDILAARKVCGHNSLHACSRCFKEFPTTTFGEKPDFTGFDRDQWPKRSLDKHREHAMKYLDAYTKAEQKRIEREQGCRYFLLK